MYSTVLQCLFLCHAKWKYRNMYVCSTTGFYNAGTSKWTNKGQFTRKSLRDSFVHFLQVSETNNDDNHM